MKNYTKAERFIICLDSFLGLEYKHKKEIINLIDKTDNVEQFIEIAKEYIIKVIGQKEHRTLKNSVSEEYADYLINALDKKGVQVTTYLSDDYPKSFLEINLPPLVIYYKGDLSVVKKDLFAMVGSRKSLPLSLKLAQRYAKDLTDAGFGLVTGIAEGVDATVLKTALENDAKAVSVIAGGFDHIYPRQHAELVDRIAKIGLVISENPPETVPKAFHYPIRNRLIAALAKGVLIVSGGMKSGTFYTAEYANDFGKDLFAIPYSVDVVSGAGCNDLIKKGAMLTDTPQDILDYYGKAVNKKTVNLSDDEKKIITALADGQLHIEKICTLMGKKIFEITPLLSVLEIKGLIAKSGNFYSLISNDLED